jgi:serine/threonine protein kinase
MIGKTIVGRYVIRKHLGGGSFGDVYEAEDIQTQQIIALKFETNDSAPQLPNEHKMYMALAGMDGIPNIYGLYDYGKSRILAMDQMGPSLESLFKRCDKQFSLKTVLMIGDQMLRIIEWVHSCGVLHRDIKPQNFLVGRGQFRNKIFLIDFGVSAPYLDPRTHEHQIYTRGNGLVGTAYYVSINTHLGDQQSRRDDLESIAYLLIRFLRGKLPWQVFHDMPPDERNEKIAQLKMQTPPKALCEGLPKEFSLMLDMIRRLNFDETPKYFWFRNLLTALFVKEGFVYDGVFDWDDEAAIHRPDPSVYLAFCAGRYQRMNERQIKVRKEGIVFPNERQMFVQAGRIVS